MAACSSPASRGRRAESPLHRTALVAIVACLLAVAAGTVAPAHASERVRGIVGRRVGLGQKHADHHPHLRFVSVSGADDALLHQVRCVFGDRQAGFGRHHHGDAARLSELERCLGVLVDERRLDRRLVGAKLFKDAHQAVVDDEEPRRERVFITRRDRAASQKSEPL